MNFIEVTIANVVGAPSKRLVNLDHVMDIQGEKVGASLLFAKDAGEGVHYSLYVMESYSELRTQINHMQGRYGE